MRTILVGVLVVAIVALAACGGGEDEATRASAAKWVGQWETTFGKMRLVYDEEYDMLRGQYAYCRGTLQANLEGDEISGNFTEDARCPERAVGQELTGTFEFRLVEKDRFEGTWRWHGAEPENPEWTGRRVQAGKVE